MIPVKIYFTVALCCGLLSACGDVQEASERNIEKAIRESVSAERVCLPTPAAVDVSGSPDVNLLLGNKTMRIAVKNIDGDKINKQALKQMDILVDEGFYQEAKEEQALSGEIKIPFRVFERTDKGNAQIQPSPHGALLCLGTKKLNKVDLFTEPTAHNGVTAVKAVYEVQLQPEKWAEKLLKHSDENFFTQAKHPRKQNMTLVLTNRGWRDMRELE
ncbi:hypothetical protein [Stenoxybacter acetivorans]|uniref:hypothetical protein n=1 Tax=Stenoxybacter acetivorans TaxID=422441 RepID=UPI0006900DD0|nr:hypothetical protein [Stenoxybacter acetivorans]